MHCSGSPGVTRDPARELPHQHSDLTYEYKFVVVRSFWFWHFWVWQINHIPGVLRKYIPYFGIHFGTQGRSNQMKKLQHRGETFGEIARYSNHRSTPSGKKKGLQMGLERRKVRNVENNCILVTNHVHNLTFGWFCRRWCRRFCRRSYVSNEKSTALATGLLQGMSSFAKYILTKTGSTGRRIRWFDRRLEGWTVRGNGRRYIQRSYRRHQRWSHERNWSIRNQSQVRWFRVFHSQSGRLKAHCVTYHNLVCPMVIRTVQNLVAWMVRMTDWYLASSKATPTVLK